MAKQSQLPLPPPLDALAAAGPVALFLDFDGTLVPIAATPDGIAVSPNLGRALERLADQNEGRVALVTGRGLDNLEQHLGPVAVARAGSHGADRRRADGSRIGDCPEPLPHEVIEALSKLADTVEGARFEPKDDGAAVHYRGAENVGPHLVEAGKAIAAEHGLDMLDGKCVIELVRPGGDKGAAVDAFMAAPPFAGSKPIFLGDDVTDEHGFAAVKRLGGFGIAVGERASTHASYHLGDTSEVYRWLGVDT